MFIMLPWIAFTVIMLCLVVRGNGYRQAFLGAAVWFSLLLSTVTELLSLCKGITFFSLAVFWGLVTLVSLLCLLLNRTYPEIRRIQLETRGICAGIGVILATTLLIALVSPPNNWDSMTYHMARVVHWIQNRSVAHYPTHITRQLYSAPWAEYAIMHLQILSGGDRFANIVQWFAMCGSIAGVSLIAKEFGAARRLQILTAAITATIPMGILQASSTQNDYVVAFWLVCFIYFGLLLVKSPNMYSSLACGVSLGLAILTKGSAYIFAFPFLMWLTLAGLKANRTGFAKIIMVVAVVAIGLNAGHYWRNYALWGNPLTTDSDKLTNDQISFDTTLSNLTRNMASNTWTPFESVNQLQFRGVKFVHVLLGSDIDDPATSLSESFTPNKTSLDEDYAGNGIHLVLAIIAIGTLAVRRNSFPKPLLWYALSLTGAFLLFCVLLKWQPWGTRLQLPLFVLAAPLIALALPLGNRRWPVPVFATLLFLSSVPWLLENRTRPLCGNWSILSDDREMIYFVKRPQLAPYYMQTAGQFANQGSCNAIGIVSSSGNSYEYPLWILLSRRMTNIPRIEHINIKNVSAGIPLTDFAPCATLQIF